MAVASALPLALAVFEAGAREDAAVEAEGVPLVNDEIVVVGLQPRRRPTLPDAPSGVAARDRDAAQHSGAAAEQDVAARNQNNQDWYKCPGLAPGNFTLAATRGGGLRRIGVGRDDWFRPLPPPNRTGGSPASGSPVSSFTSMRIGPLTQRRLQS